MKSPGVHFPPPLLFLIPLAAGAILRRWWDLELLQPPWKIFGSMAGWALIGFWAVLTGWAMITFSRHRTAIYPNRPASRLVTSGPYRLTRNPMYVSLSALYIGVSLLMNNGWPLLFFPLVPWSVYLLVIRNEERYLAAAFGIEYEDYRAAVRRWL
jgi:protein-S-isoprenylcysteine O-methyltransferase Ste14